MPPLEEYMERAEEFVQEVYNGFGAAGNAASLTPEYSKLLGKAHLCRTTSRTVANYRESNIPTEQVAADADAARQTFVKAYIEFLKNHPTC
jgi:hypothetical protein